MFCSHSTDLIMPRCNSHLRCVERCHILMLLVEHLTCFITSTFSVFLIFAAVEIKHNGINTINGYSGSTMQKLNFLNTIFNNRIVFNTSFRPIKSTVISDQLVNFSKKLSEGVVECCLFHKQILGVFCTLGTFYV